MQNDRIENVMSVDVDVRVPKGEDDSTHYIPSLRGRNGDGGSGGGGEIKSAQLEDFVLKDRAELLAKWGRERVISPTTSTADSPRATVG